MRGEDLLLVAVLGLQPGNSPACAGRTPAVSCRRLPLVEQPRVRGEDAYPKSQSTFAPGTAPRARGGHFLTSYFSNSNVVLHSLLGSVPDSGPAEGMCPTLEEVQRGG
jgi:hypothetical protein